ncbi:hypothetical protein HU200_027330 [Digitaria exilis]|uniref:F-box domain-containing protein n=1 Tax=Digitaria exilis TaxID=1010633 RepID=A0A835C783_9POAL|nr:hypothetical protein HU200_027330 [Digitaria exilis]
MAPDMTDPQPAAKVGSADLLSALPDALLHSIVSNLTSRQAVQTSALSRRWRELWRSAPCVDVDSEEPIRSREQWDKLEDFTTNLLMHHIAPRPRHFKLPPLGSTSDRLRRLHLFGVFLDGGFAEHIRTRCPVLEVLELSACVCDFQEIASSTLKILDIGCGVDSLVRVCVTADEEACEFDAMSTMILRELFAKLVIVRALELSCFAKVVRMYTTILKDLLSLTIYTTTTTKY